MLDKMDEEVKAMEKELIHIAWAMRGTPLSEVYALSPSQREHMAKLFEENIDTTSKTGIAFI